MSVLYTFIEQRVFSWGETILKVTAMIEFILHEAQICLIIGDLARSLKSVSIDGTTWLRGPGLTLDEIYVKVNGLDRSFHINSLYI